MGAIATIRPMADQDANQGSNPPQGDPPPQQSGQDPATFTQKFSHSPVAARVPERIARGVFSSGVCIQDTPTEFVLDFLQALSKPAAVVSRIVVAPPVMGGLIQTLRNGLNQYSQNFGAPAPLPRPPQNRPPTIQEIYETFKLPEELYSGIYSNSFLINFDPAQFVIDFITGFYPTASVSARVYLSAQQVPRVLDAMGGAMQQHIARYHQQQPPPQQHQQNPPPGPPSPPSQS